MKRIAGLLLASVLCGNAEESAEQRLARIEQPYAKCMFSRAAKYGSPKRVTAVQAKRVAAACSGELNAVLDDGTRNGGFKPRELSELAPGGPVWPSEYDYWEMNLENRYMRQISKAVLPLPQI